jgi:soluble lytic murein transglycosylase-like protein
MFLALVCVTAPAQVPYWGTFQAVAGPRAVDRAAQVRAESAFNPRAQSYILRNGEKVPCAQGLAQFTPATWKDWGKGGSPWVPEDAIDAQHAYMLYLEGRCSGDWVAALGAYNAGLGSIRKAQRLAVAMGLPGNRAWLQALPGVTKHHAAETQGYVLRIETVHIPWVKKRAGA